MAQQFTKWDSTYDGMMPEEDGEYVLWKDVAPYIKEVENTAPNSIKAEILLLIQRTKQCACADDMGSVKGLLEQIDAKLSAV